MKSVKEYIESGILELYVLGMASAEEIKGVEEMAAAHEAVRMEIDAISETLLMHAEAPGKAPSSTIKTFIMATVDFSERMQNGEAPSFPPELNESSDPTDYSEWLDRPDMIAAGDFENSYAKIIGHTPECTTAIVWIKDMAPQEVHHDEIEKFLILEGSCDIMIGDTVRHFVPGDYLSMPLHVSHHVKVTSEIPCKVILQRIAA